MILTAIAVMCHDAIMVMMAIMSVIVVMWMKMTNGGDDDG